MMDETFWSNEIAVSLAKNDQLKLTSDHWDIINFLRGFGEGRAEYDVFSEIEKRFGKQKAANINKIFKLKKYHREGTSKLYTGLQQAASYAKVNLGSIVVNGRVYQLDVYGYLDDVQGWQSELAKILAILDGVDLIKEHWIVIDIIRKLYDKNKCRPSTIMLVNEMEKYFGEEKANPRYIYLGCCLGCRNGLVLLLLFYCFLDFI